MSENVSIQEGSKRFNFTNDKIRTAQANSDEPVIWVPESSVQREDLHVSENGEYEPDSDVYAFNEVTVNVAGRVTNGNTMISGGGSGGALEQELLADHIQIALRPIHEQQGLKYHNGDTIDAAGLVCTIHNADGSLWENPNYPFSTLQYSGEHAGGVPVSIGELTIDPTTAHLSTAEWWYADVPLPINIGGGTSFASEFHYAQASGSHISFGIFNADVFFYKPSNNNGFRVVLTTADGQYTNAEKTWSTYPDRNFPIRCWVEALNVNGSRDCSIRFSSSVSSGYVSSEISYPLGNSKLIHNPDQRTQDITVKWPRYGDGVVLSDSFEIEVVADDGFSGTSGTF